MSKLKAVGGFIFAGGFTLGVKRAGFDVLAQLEDGMYGVETTRANHKGLAVHSQQNVWPLEELATQKVDFVYGNPPCAPFSNAGISSKKVGKMTSWWKQDPRAQCVRKLFHVLEVLRPTVWAWESVQPALTRGREMVDELTTVAGALGYAASYVLFNNGHLGVPQIRRRFFCVFHRVKLDFEGAYDVDTPVMTVRDAWKDLLDGTLVDGSPEPPAPTKNPEHLALLKKIPQGGSLRRAWEDANPVETRTLNALGHVKGRPRFLDVRLAWDRPSPTLTGGATKFHPDKDRYITLLEQQLLCGYPADYEFIGATLATKYAQTAQAVMPPTGQWLAEIVRRGIERNEPEKPGAVYGVDLERGIVRQIELGSAVRAGHRTAQSGECGATEDTPPQKGAASQPKGKRKAPARRRAPARSDVEAPPTPPGAYAGPTALARALIPQNVEDDAILAATKKMFGPGTAQPFKFTRTDLTRLRTRVARQTLDTAIAKED